MFAAAILAFAAPASAPASATVRVLRPVVVRSADAGRRQRWRERIVRRPDGTVELQRLLELE